MASNFYLGLVHYPIKNKTGEKVCTSVTNLDIHDIARSSRTFGVKNYFIVTPLKPQQQLVQRILDHWEKEESSVYNPDRFDALSYVKLVDSIEDAVAKIEAAEGQIPAVAITGAQFFGRCIKIEDMSLKMQIDNRPWLLLFGTGSGLHADVVETAEYKIEGISGMASDGYNHLSVRSAVAIYLDRLARLKNKPH